LQIEENTNENNTIIFNKDNISIYNDNKDKDKYEQKIDDKDK